MEKGINLTEDGFNLRLAKLKGAIVKYLIETDYGDQRLFRRLDNFGPNVVEFVYANKNDLDNNHLAAYLSTTDRIYINIDTVNSEIDKMDMSEEEIEMFLNHTLLHEMLHYVALSANRTGLSEYNPHQYELLNEAVTEIIAFTILDPENIEERIEKSGYRNITEFVLDYISNNDYDLIEAYFSGKGIKYFSLEDRKEIKKLNVVLNNITKQEFAYLNPLVINYYNSAVELLLGNNDIPEDSLLYTNMSELSFSIDNDMNHFAKLSLDDIGRFMFNKEALLNNDIPSESKYESFVFNLLFAASYDRENDTFGYEHLGRDFNEVCHRYLVLRTMHKDDLEEALLENDYKTEAVMNIHILNTKVDNFFEGYFYADWPRVGKRLDKETIRFIHDEVLPSCEDDSSIGEKEFCLK